LLPGWAAELRQMRKNADAAKVQQAEAEANMEALEKKAQKAYEQDLKDAEQVRALEVGEWVRAAHGAGQSRGCGSCGAWWSRGPQACVVYQAQAQQAGPALGGSGSRCWAVVRPYQAPKPPSQMFCQN